MNQRVGAAKGKWGLYSPTMRRKGGLPAGRAMSDCSFWAAKSPMRASTYAEPLSGPFWMEGTRPFTGWTSLVVLLMGGDDRGAAAARHS